MSDVLLISVRLHEGWYHGSDSTPTPARMFQSLVAGAGISGPLDEPTISALTWLEELEQPPIVACPSTTRGRTIVNYVPNNDLDSKQGDYRRIGEIRTKKRVSPLLFNSQIPFLFAWRFDEDIEKAKQICRLADGVYQLGRTVDMAWAWAELLSTDELFEKLNSYPGIVRHPAPGNGSVDCPAPGSLESLSRRYAAAAVRFSSTADRKGQTFHRRPKPKWKKVNYDGTGSRLVLELRRSDDTGFAPWPQERAVKLVELVRDASAEKLKAALPDRVADIDQVLFGRQPNGTNNGPASTRVRIVPLPSIGHEQADRRIRRVLVEIPAACPFRPDDISWAMSGLQLSDAAVPEAIDVARSIDHEQLRHYGTEKPVRRWHTVTPVVLPGATRRRIDPQRSRPEAKAGQEKQAEHVAASFAVAQALRHAGVGSKVRSVRVQREPFERNGQRIEPFAEGTRFSKHSLWHVEVELESPVRGPLVIGDGRFLGLGLLQPGPTSDGVFVFSVESGLNANPDPMRLSRALRRAVMARVRDVLGRDRLPTYFTGHRPDGSPARSDDEPHLTFLFDPLESALLVIAPQQSDCPTNGPHKKDLATLETALVDFDELRSGVDGHLRVQQVSIDLTQHHLFSSSQVWHSLTPYQVNRHARRSTAENTLKKDLIAECERRGLPRPQIAVVDWTAEPGIGLRGRVRLTFARVVSGPIILGRTRHIGGGVFATAESD